MSVIEGSKRWADILQLVSKCWAEYSDPKATRPMLLVGQMITCLDEFQQFLNQHYSNKVPAELVMNDETRNKVEILRNFYEEQLLREGQHEHPLVSESIIEPQEFSQVFHAGKNDELHSSRINYSRQNKDTDENVFARFKSINRDLMRDHPFSGEYHDFPAFWKRFETLIDQIVQLI